MKKFVMKQFFNNLNKIIAKFFFLWQKVINEIYEKNMKMKFLILFQ